MPGSKIFFSFTNVRTLQITDFRSHFIKRGTNDRQSSQKIGMAVALNDLGSQTGSLDT